VGGEYLGKIGNAFMAADAAKIFVPRRESNGFRRPKADGKKRLKFITRKQSQKERSKGGMSHRLSQ